jgi:hypothetical protein
MQKQIVCNFPLDGATCPNSPAQQIVVESGAEIAMNENDMLEVAASW